MRNDIYPYEFYAKLDSKISYGCTIPGLVFPEKTNKESRMAKVTLELDEYDVRYLQKIADDRAMSKNPDDYDYDFTDVYDSSPQQFVLDIVAAAVKQGIITPREPDITKRLWWNIEALISKERARNRLITAKFREFEWKRMTDEELFAYTKAHPSPFNLFSESLKFRGLEVEFEIKEGHPFVKFSKGDKELNMMGFTDEEQEIMLEVSTDLLTELKEAE